MDGDFKTLDSIIKGFMKGNLAIDCYKASQDQIEELSDILSTTEAKPFDDTSFESYIVRYRLTYPLLVCDEREVSSYTSTSRNCRANIISIQDVIDVSRNGRVVYTELDFDDAFSQLQEVS